MALCWLTGITPGVKRYRSLRPLVSEGFLLTFPLSRIFSTRYQIKIRRQEKSVIQTIDHACLPQAGTSDVRLKRRNGQRVDRDDGEIGDWKRKNANRSDRTDTLAIRWWHNERNVWCLKSEVQCLNCRKIIMGRWGGDQLGDKHHTKNERRFLARFKNNSSVPSTQKTGRRVHPAT